MRFQIQQSEYEFGFEFVNLLLKIKGKGGGGVWEREGRPNFVIFVAWRAFFIGIHSMQGWTATTRHGVTRKRSPKKFNA